MSVKRVAGKKHGFPFKEITDSLAGPSDVFIHAGFNVEGNPAFALVALTAVLKGHYISALGWTFAHSGRTTLGLWH